MSEESSQKKNGLWEWVKAISTLSLVSVVSYKILVTETNLTVDFPTLLSLLLALFSVALAALFYFKATETSNTFYDNTYNFTKDIAQLLVKMESGFGERLRNLDEGYTSMRNSLQHYNYSPSIDVENTKKKIENEKMEMEKVVLERSQIIEQLIERSNLQEEEKSQILTKLKTKEKELFDAQNELSKMNKKLFIERMEKKRLKNSEIDLDSGLAEYTKFSVLPKIGLERILGASNITINRKFNSIVDELPREYIKDLEHEGYYLNNTLTDRGCHLLKYLAETTHQKNRITESRI